jgi:hypothetical protein
MVTPRIINSDTLSIPGIGGGRLGILERGRLNIISFDFLLLSFRLHVSAHLAILSSSEVVVSSADAGIKTLLSSAYLRNLLLQYIGFNPEIVTTKWGGPSPDPCIKLAFI